jgi:hypothetical protein
VEIQSADSELTGGNLTSSGSEKYLSILSCASKTINNQARVIECSTGGTHSNMANADVIDGLALMHCAACALRSLNSTITSAPLLSDFCFH